MSNEKIGLNDTWEEILKKMSQGNPGALSVMMRFLKEDPAGLMVILHLDDMGMRGPAIWVGYKDHCGEDLAKFKEAIFARSPEMVETVRRCGYDAAVGGRS